MKYLTISLCILFFSMSGFSQNEQWTIYTPDNSGLPNDQIRAITFDNNGDKVIATNLGVVNFDGTNWTAYSDDNTSLPSNNIQVVEVDPDGKLWVATSSGLGIFDGNQLTNYTTFNSDLPHNSIRSMALNSIGEAWIGASNLFGTSGGLAHFDGTNWTIYDTDNSDLPHNFIGSIAIDENDDVWLGTNSGLAFFDGTDFTVYNTSNSDIPENQIRALAIDTDGVWMRSGGLTFFDGTNWINYNVDNSPLPENNITEIGIDSFGGLWMGLYSQGLVYFDGTNWTHYTDENSDLPYDAVRAVAVESNDTKWVGGTINGLAKLETCSFQADEINVTNPTCFGDADGSITITVTGGEEPYEFNWVDGPQGSNTYSNLGAGDYTVNISEAGGCALEITTTVDEGSQVGIDFEYEQPQCFESTDGSITATASGGAEPYTFNWTDGPDDSSTYSDLIAGDYTLTVTDANGCQSEATATLTEPEALTAQIESSTDVTCAGENNGSITATASGGTGAHFFSLDGGSPQISGTFSGLAAGNYTVTVSDESGCETEATAEIAEGAVVELTLDATDPLCFGESNGSIIPMPTGGQEPYNISWTGAPEDFPPYTDLSSGVYTVAVTDAIGCEAQATVTLTEPAELTAQVESSTDVTCASENDGSITVAASGGTGDHSFSLNGETPQASGTFNGLAAGNYMITVADENGCETEVTADIAGGTEIDLTFDSTSPTCFGESNGTITATATGGAEPYTFNWTDGPDDSSTYSDLPAGDYTVTATDDNGCEAQATVTLTEPEELTAQIESSTNVTCAGFNNGSITMAASGGTGDHNFSLNGETPQTSGIFNGLAAGNYTITVTDENGCETEVTTEIEAGAVFELTLDVTDPLCFGESNGSILLVPTGGQPPYNYEVIGQPGDSGPLNGLSAGVYIVTVLDATGCEAEATATLTEPEELTVQIESSTDVTCAGENNGSITVSAAGGTGDYTFSLNGAEPVTAGAFTDLSPGDYAITVTDENGCQAEITADIAEGAVVELTLDATDPLCFGESNGAITATATGGQAPYTFNGTDVSDDAVTYSDLADGEYTITVIDANGCEAEATTSLTEPEELTAQIESSNDVSCAGDSDGSVTVTASGGTGALLFSLDGGVPQTNGTFEGLEAGAHAITVTDENDCETEVEVNIAEPEPAEVAFEFTSNQDEVTFTNNSSEGEFLWDFGDGNTSDEENPVHSYSEDGVYEVCLTLTTDCGEFTSCQDVEVIIISVEEGEAIEVSVYPNPASEKLTFEVSKGEAHTIEFRDTHGRLLTTQEVVSQKSSINISTHSSGVYFYRILSQSGEVVKRGRVAVE